MAIDSELDERVSAPSAAQSQTRANIVEAATILFGQSGFDATSVRVVAARAGTSPGSINYHFGSKAGLVRAVLNRVAGPVTEQRLTGLAEMNAKHEGGPIPVEDLLRTFLAPLYEGVGETRREEISRLLAQVTVSTDPTFGGYWVEMFGPTGEAFVWAFAKSLPHLDTGTVFYRYQCLLMATYDSRAYAPWYQSWALEHFGLSETSPSYEQRVGMFQKFFEAPA